MFSQNFIPLFWELFHDETDLRVIRVLKFLHFAVPGISNAVSFRTGQVLFSMLFLALTTQTPVFLGTLLSVVTTPHETCTRSSYLSTVNRLPVHQPETSRTWVTSMMGHTRSYLSSVKR